jgi:hypothetical protein
MLMQSPNSFEDIVNRQAPCPIDEAAMAARTNAVSAEYDAKFRDLTARTEAESKDIEEDTPDPSTGEVIINADIEIGSRSHTIVMDLPEFTMSNQSFVVSVPETVMKRQEWKYKVPASRMVTKCIDGPPEIVCPTKMRCVLGVCTKVPDGPCYTRRGTICTDVPEFYMKETTTILDVPEARMNRRTYATKVPQVRMVQRTLTFNVPTVTVKNVRAEMREVKERSEALQNDTQGQSTALAAAMQQDIERANGEVVAEQYACNRDHLNAVLQAGLTYFDNQIAIFAAARDKAVEVGASEIANQNGKTIEQLVAARNTFADDTRAAISKLGPIEKRHIDQVMAVS